MHDQQKLSLQHQTEFDGGNLNSYLTVFNLDQETAGYLVGKDSYKDDIFFEYFNGDRQAMNKVGMEKSSLLEHRYDCWRIIK